MKTTTNDVRNADYAWIPGCGETEVPFEYQHRIYCYMWNYILRIHRYYCLTSDTFLEDLPR